MSSSVIAPVIQFSDIDWVSDTELSTFEMWDFGSDTQQSNDDLSAIIDFNTLASESDLMTLQQTIEDLHSGTQSKRGLTPPILREVDSPPKSPSIGINDQKASNSDLIDSTLQTLVGMPQVTQKKEEGEFQVVVGPEQKETEDQFRDLRYRLQKGLFPQAGPREAIKMKPMSLHLKTLEEMDTPSESIQNATGIRKLVKKITKLDKIPCDLRFGFQTRAALLLERWKLSLRTEGLTPSLVTQLSAMPDNQECSNAQGLQGTLGDLVGASASGSLIEERQAEMTAGPNVCFMSNSKPSNTPVVVTALKQSSTPLAPIFEADLSCKFKQQNEVIDLTNDEELDMDTESKLPRLSTGDCSSPEIDATDESQGSPSSPLNSTGLVSCNVLRKTSFLSSTSDINVKKRSWSESSSDQSSPTTSPDTDTESKLPRLSTGHHSPQATIVTSEKHRSISPSLKSPRTVLREVLRRASFSPSASHIGTREQSCSGSSSDQISPTTALDTIRSSSGRGGDIQSLDLAPKSAGQNPPLRGRKRQKTSAKQLLDFEVTHMEESLSGLKEMIYQTERDIEAIEGRKARFLAENATEMTSAIDRSERLSHSMQILLDWAAQNSIITQEWESSQ